MSNAPRAIAVLVLALAACSPTAAPSASPGAAWSRHELPADQPRIDALAEKPDGYIGVGPRSGEDGAGSAIWTSADGLAWQQVDAAREGRNLADIVSGGPGFVALSSSPGGAWTSPDGTSWTQSAGTDAFGEATPMALAAGQGKIVAAGWNGLWSSPDGASWTLGTSPDEDGRPTDVVAGGPGFVAVGSMPVASTESRGLVWTSADGVTWQRLPNDPVFEKSEVLSVAADRDRLVATGWSTDEEAGIFFKPTAWTSTDGTTWTRATVNDPHVPVMDPQLGALEGALMTDVVRGPAGWVAAGTSLDARDGEGHQDVAIWTSADGTTWERVPPGPMFEAGAAEQMRYGTRTLLGTADTVLLTGTTSNGGATWASPPRAGGTAPSGATAAPVGTSPSADASTSP